MDVNCTSKKPSAECSCVRGPGMSQSKERNQMIGGHQNLVITRTGLNIGHLLTLLRCNILYVKSFPVKEHNIQGRRARVSLSSLR